MEIRFNTRTKHMSSLIMSCFINLEGQVAFFSICFKIPDALNGKKEKIPLQHFSLSAAVKHFSSIISK